MKRVAIGIRSHFVTRLPEWIMAATMTAEGGLLLQSGSTLNSTRAYAPLKSLATEDAWGTFAVLIGTAWLVALFLNGTFLGFRRISPWLRALSALATSSYMTAFATGMKLGNPVGDGFLMHGTIAATAAVYCAIIAREVKAVDKEAEQWRQSRPKLKTGLS